MVNVIGPHEKPTRRMPQRSELVLGPIPNRMEHLVTNRLAAALMIRSDSRKVAESEPDNHLAFVACSRQCSATIA